MTAIPWPTLGPLDPAQVADRAQLEGHLDGLAEPPPCRDGDSRDRGFWTSDVHEFQKLAALACQPCPALAACQDFGLSWPSERGIYGGLMPAKRTVLSRERRAS